LVIVIVAGLATLAIQPESAWAHADVTQAEPEPNAELDVAPSQIVMLFTEPVEQGFSEIAVLNAQADRVDNADSFVDPAEPSAMSVTLSTLPNGTYTVRWRNVSAVDGHRVDGSYVFSVGEPVTAGNEIGESDPPLFQSSLDPVLRWLVFLGVLGLIGGLGFEVFVFRPALGKSNGSDALLLESEVLELLQKLAKWAVALAAVASVAQLVLQTAVVTGTSLVSALGAPMGAVLTGTGWGNLWIWRVVLLGLMGLVVMVRRRSSSGAPTEAFHLGGQGPSVIGLMLGAGVILTLSLVSHGAATGGIEAEAIVSDAFHLVAAALWVGGVLGLGASMKVSRRFPPSPDDESFMSPVISRFSLVAAMSVGTLVVTGVFGAWAQITRFVAFETAYGRAFLIKIALFVVVVSLGGINSLRSRAARARFHPTRGVKPSIVRAEFAVGVLVILVAGVLTSLEPARQVASRDGLGNPAPITFLDTLEGADISVQMDPGTIGFNRVIVSLADARGAPIDDAGVRVAIAHVGSDVRYGSLSLLSVGNGEYLLDNVPLSVAGEWEVDLTVQGADAFDARIAFTFLAVAGTGNVDIAPSGIGGRLYGGLELVYGGLLMLILTTPIAMRRTAKSGWIVLAPGIIVFIVGLLIVAQSGQLRGRSTSIEGFSMSRSGVSTFGSASAGLLGGDGPQVLIPESDMAALLHAGTSSGR
jgi:copper transport protein